MKILCIDVETEPTTAYVWRTFKENISPEQIIKPGGLLCFSALWYGADEDDVEFYSKWTTGRGKMVRAAHRLLNEADVVTHYYGSAFDVPVLNTEFIQYGLPPPAPFHQIDLKKVVQKVMKAPSNRLAFIAPFLKIGEKVKHEGFELWRGVMEGDEGMRTKMEEYNIQDTLLLPGLYETLRPWIQDHPNAGMFEGDADEMKCPRCGGELVRKGFRRAATYTYRRYQCKSCGGWQRDRLSTREAGNPAALRTL